MIKDVIGANRSGEVNPILTPCLCYGVPSGFYNGRVVEVSGGGRKSSTRAAHGGVHIGDLVRADSHALMPTLPRYGPDRPACPDARHISAPALSPYQRNRRNGHPWRVSFSVKPGRKQEFVQPQPSNRIVSSGSRPNRGPEWNQVCHPSRRPLSSGLRSSNAGTLPRSRTN